MKKQIKKLHLSKRTISNLSESAMKTQMGGGATKKGCETAEGCSGYCSENCTYGCTFLACTNGCTITCKGHSCKGNGCL